MGGGNVTKKQKKVNRCLLFWRIVLTLLCWTIMTAPALLFMAYKPTWWGKGLPFNKISWCPLIRISWIDKNIPITLPITLIISLLICYILFEPVRLTIYTITIFLLLLMGMMFCSVAVILAFLIAAFMATIIGMVIYEMINGICEELAETKWWLSFKIWIYKFYKETLCPDVSFEHIHAE